MILVYLSSTRSNELELGQEFVPCFWLPVVFLVVWRLVLLLDLWRTDLRAGGGPTDGVLRSRYLCGRRARRGRSRGRSSFSSPSIASAVRFGTTGVGLCAVDGS